MTFGDNAAELAGYAAALLGWTPGEFWSATPEELATALGAGRQPTEPVDRGLIERLRAQFPDNRGS